MIAAVYAVVFILNGKINCESDMSFVKNLYVIAFIEGKERKGLDKVFEKWARGNSPQSSSIEYTSDYLNKLGTKSIAICYNKDIELEKNVAAKVKEYCKEKVELVGCMTDSESIGKISNADEIVSIVGNESELEVVENLKNTYIVSNSPKVIKDKTKNRTKSNNAKGVENLLKKLF